MSISTARSYVVRVQNDIADLRNKDAQEAKKEADLTQKMARATADARTTKSVSTMTSKLRDAERAANDITTVQKKRADLAKRLAGKQSDLNRYQTDLSREEERERKRIAAEEKKLHDQRDRQIKDMERKIREQSTAFHAPSRIATSESDETYDVFVSHASEDKDSFVRPLAEKLAEANIKVWYDEFSLKWGDGLRRNIDKGLARSSFGIVVLSESFFKKEWPQKELDGLVQLEMAGKSRILPIWHKISKDEVAAQSPTLADKVALNTAIMTTDEIVAELVALCAKK